MSNVLMGCVQPVWRSCDIVITGAATGVREHVQRTRSVKHTGQTLELIALLLFALYSAGSVHTAIKEAVCTNKGTVIEKCNEKYVPDAGAPRALSQRYKYIRKYIYKVYIYKVYIYNLEQD